MRYLLLFLILSLPVAAQNREVDSDGEPTEMPENYLEGDLSQQNSNNNNVSTTYNGNAPCSMPTSTAIAPSDQLGCAVLPAKHNQWRPRFYVWHIARHLRAGPAV